MADDSATISSMSETRSSDTGSTTLTVESWLPLVEMKAEPIRLCRDTPGHPELFAQYAERIWAMSKRLGGNAQGLYDDVWDAFGRNLPTHRFWILKHEGKLVGHLLAVVRQISGEWVAYIPQEQIDDPKAVSQGQVDAIIADLETWVQGLRQSHNLPITRLVMETYRPGAQWIKRYGFVEHSTIYERRIP